MSLRIGIAIMAIWAASQAAHAQTAPADDEQALRQAEQAGEALYRIERALQAAAKEGERSRSFRKDTRVQGQVASLQGQNIQITYVGDEHGVPVGLYQLSVDASGQPRTALEKLTPQPLNAALRLQYDIIQRARSVDRTQCANNVETLVLPAAQGWHAYVLPRAAFADVYLLGGSYRIALPASGDSVTEAQPLASECVLVQNKADAGMLLFAEDRAEMPNELHVYISHLAGKPMYITTNPNGYTWLIENGRIRQVQGMP